MKLPGKIWITEETAQYGGHTEPYLSINDPADLSPGAMPYVPASEAEALRERIAKLEQDNDKLTALLVCEDETIHRLEGALEKIAKADCPSYVAHPQSVWWIEHVQSIAREALGGEGKK